MNYRDNPYDCGDQMLRGLGTYWYYIYQDRAKLQNHYRGFFEEAGQTYLNFLETMATISRFNIPVFHKENWHYLTFLESDINSQILRYGDGANYGDGYQYGVRFVKTDNSITLPENLRSAQFMFNRLLEPSKTWVAGVDFKIDVPGNKVYFRDNPFDSDLVAKRNIVDDAGNVIDRQAALWIYGGEYDLQYCWIHWGYALKVWMQSSGWYKDFINALANSYVQAPTLASLQGMLSALTGIPLIIEPTETVEVVLTEPDVKQVVTDQHVYELPLTANVIVAAGDVLHGGEPITDGLLLLELNDRLPTAIELPGFSFGTNFLAQTAPLGPLFSELLFENKVVPLQYIGIDQEGKAEVRFEVSGFPGDVEAFWVAVQRRGWDSGKVLADYLDKRANPVGPPDPANLPATINPLEFILENLMRNNLMLIKIRPEQFPAGAPGTEFFHYLRRALPPQVTYAVYVELSLGIDYIDFSDTAFQSEDLQLIDAIDPLVETIGPSYVEEAIAARPVKEC